MRKKVFIFWTILVCFLFVGNIVLHIFPLPNITGLEVTQTHSYHIDNNKYTMTDSDPQMIVENMKGNVDGVCIEFTQALSQDTNIQLFVPNEQGIFEEKNSYKIQGKAGENKVQISFPKGEYEILRVDIDGTFFLKRIYQLPVSKQLAFVNESACYCMWAICTLLALLITIVGFYISSISEVYEKVYFAITKTYKRIVKTESVGCVMIGIMIALMSGLICEFMISRIKRMQYSRSEMMIVVTLVFIIYTIIRMRKWYEKRIEAMVCIIMIMCGMVFTTVMPVSVGVSWDDEIHYLQTAKAARGLLGDISSADQMFKDTYTDIIYNPEYNYSKDGQKAKVKQYDEEYEKGECVTIEGSRVTMHSIGYIPAIIGMWIGFGLFLPFSATIILMRFVNVVFIAILLYFAMKNVKSGKLLIAAFALIPTVFFLASSFSYDTWLTMLMLYGFTRYFGELQRKDKMFTLRDFLLIFIPLFLALPPKIVYAPMLFLTAYMPSKKFKEKKWCYAYRACFILAALVCVAGIAFILSGKINLGTGDTRGGDVNPMMQLAYIISDLPGYSKTLTGFLANYFSYNSSSSYLTFMAYAGEIKWQWFSIIILFFTAFTDRIPEIDRKTIPVICKLESAVMVWIIGAICATVMYLAFTPVGLDQINGCQGRYIIPALFPMLYEVSRFGGKSIICNKVKKEYYNMGVIAASVVFLMCNLWINIVSKY